MRIAYFVHDVNDAAVAKRIRLLTGAGVQFTLLGFRRTPTAPQTVEGAPVVDLGQTADAKLLQRAGSVAANLLQIGRWRSILCSADVVMARNLEVLVLAAAARRLHAPTARLIYECLDIHGLMLRANAAGAALRSLESGLLNASDLLIVSSPAFLGQYFEPFQAVSQRPRLETLLLENKTLPPPGMDRADRPALAPLPPWRIGWFGMIRCRRSLDLLCGLARRRPDLVQVEIRGRPSYTEFDDFNRQTGATPGVTFGGPYAAEDLADMYGSVHFNWSIDYFQDDGNSRWLLPNRLYEGGCFAVPPIAREGSESSLWLARRGLGISLKAPEEELEPFLRALSPQRYEAMVQSCRAAPRQDFVIGARDGLDLAQKLLGKAERPPAALGTPVMREA